MSTSPPIQYSGPAISSEVPWETRRHLQLLYQKLGNHTQAFQHVANQIAGIKTGSTTTNIIEGGGDTPPPPPSAGFIGQGLINNQSGATSYVVQSGDNGILLILNDASPVAVSLTTIGAPFYLIVTNFGAGTVTLTPSTGTVNGGASLSLLQNQTVYAACDSTNWHTTALPVPPQNTSAVTHEFLTAYDAATGAFSQAQPAYSDISGTPQLANTTAPIAHQWLASYDATTGNFTQTQPAVGDVSGAAPLASPALTGAPTAPTAAPLTNDTQVATTAYTDAAVGIEKTRALAAEALLAPIASPTFTGIVTQPDATVLTTATTATTATAGTATLPAGPQLFLSISVNGTAYKIPLYLP